MSDWRKEITQSFRNNEAREISQVLASIEPGVTATSKLRIAMKFEMEVWKKADSLDDYKKRISKQLRKLQEKYRPTQDPSVSAKEQLITAIKQKHGETIKYIVTKAHSAIAEAANKYGQDRAMHIRQFTDQVKVFAKDLGLLNPGDQPNMTLTVETFQKMQDTLDQKVENVRAHVVKLADGDTFYKETLQKTESNFQGEPAKRLSDNVRKRYRESLKMELEPTKMLQEALEQSQQPVPVPTRSQKNDDAAALVHIQKLRAASMVLLSYMAIDDKALVPTSTLTKNHTIASEGIQFVKNVIKDHRKNIDPKKCTLENAWGQLILPEEQPPDKKQKLGPPVTSSRVLLTAGRKCPQNVLSALHAKQARLVRPPPNGEGTYMVLEFEDAFTMTIYFQPLVINIRAFEKAKETRIVCADWAPLHQGLVHNHDEQLAVYGASGSYKSVGGIVEERLRDASAHATQMLRKMFTLAYRENESEADTEVRETNALLDFLSIARKTYLPEWKDHTE